MHILPTVCVLGALILSPATQDPKPPAPQSSPTERAAIDRRKLRRDMQGAWNLVRMRTQTLVNEGRKDVGYCLISGSHMSIELHLGWVDAAGEPLGRVFQSGMHTFEIDDRGRMNTSALIGAFVNRALALEFESPGNSRTYEVSVAGNQLTMARADGQVLVFERIVDDAEGRDFYGRPVRSSKKGSDRGKDEPPRD